MASSSVEYCKSVISLTEIYQYELVLEQVEVAKLVGVKKRYHPYNFQQYFQQLDYPNLTLHRAILDPNMDIVLSASS